MEIIGNGVVVGLQLSQINEMSLYEYAWIIAQYAKANGADESTKGGVTGAELDELSQFMDNIPLKVQ